MSWWHRLLAWATPRVALPPRPEPIDLGRHRANVALADAWQRTIDARLELLDEQVGDLARELELHRLREHGPLDRAAP